MKRAVILVLAAIFVLSVTTFAFGYGYDTSGTTTIGGNTYYDSDTVTDPHGGYAASTDKCKVCHAIHQATGTYVLLRSGANDALSACEACHVAGAPLTQLAVYGGSSDNYDATPGSYAPADDLGDRRHTLWSAGNIPIPDSTITTYTAGGFTCSHCHSVHGANCYYDCIAKLDPNGDGAVQLKDGATVTVAAFIADPTSYPRAYQNNTETQNQFCADCHNLNFYTTTGQGTHVMTDTTTTMYSGVSQITVQTAWESSRNCRRCHRGGLSGGTVPTDYTSGGTFDTYVTTYTSSGGPVTADAWNESFPHLTPGKYFLKDAYTGTGLDNVCIDCHRDPGDPDNTGVGKTY